MEDNETKKSEVEVDGLGLIDVASEDDSLLFSSFPDPTSYEFSEADEDKKDLNDDKDQNFMKDTEYCDEETLVSSVEEKEEVLQPRESPEPQKAVKAGKYNLRKSLAWDNAFFTSAGVLEPEELSSMMESNHKSARKCLPAIQEDINRSTESLSSFQSDCTVENSQEFILFEDVRASIQRSAKASDAATPGKINEQGETSPTSSTVDVLASEEKMKPKASPKKPSIRAQGLGKATKQPVGARGLSTSTPKPPNGLSKVRHLSTTSMSRASLDINKAKQEKNSKLPAGKEPLGPRISMSRSARPTLPKPAVIKSSLRSSAASKNELTSSCSSLESCASASSSVSHKSSLDSIKKKNDSSSRLASHSLVNRSTSRGIMGQPRIPPQPTNKTSKSKLSCSVPSDGSISERPSRASATSKMAKDNQKTVSGEKGHANDNTLQTVKPLKNSKDASILQADAKEGTIRVSAISGGLVPPTSMKPSGLRVPSPKIGFFDGARHGSSSSASKRSGKSQLTKSPSSSNSKTKAGTRLVSASSPKVQNKLYSKINAEDQLEG
ncbi:hypothetical protein EUTSA_v10010259mg [Eutrema salsugineum]|uniref:Uncharacterized protein n=1 Tax=Eutrema salsugineum TaxID=72664 RepID=V4LRP9_EUTSA|nr:uncharacterized protein LOC18021602 [Eutrema salsugineum]ESQ45157.1 hypothetical protein EUTSA_v10010259mg [Eutrema salsugineum]